MPTINYAAKYSPKIDERFKAGAYTNSIVNNDYDFIGVKTVNVYSVPTAPMNDYKMTGANRYGTPEELGNSVQELTLTKDRSFTFTIDRANYDDTMMINSAGQALQRQIDEVIIPELDIYRISVICANAGTTVENAITSDNAYSEFLNATAVLTENKCPVSGRVAFVTPSYYNTIKLDPAFVKQGDSSQRITLTGQYGSIDGIPVIMVPASYMPENVAFFVTNPIAAIGPVKLTDYNIHQNPPGLNGWLAEGRIRYDTFVLNNKKGAIYVHKTPGVLGTLSVNSAAGGSGQTVITVTPSAREGYKLMYKTASSTAPAVTYDQDLSSWTELPAGGVITATTGHKITVAEVNGENKARKAGNATVTAGA